jgi:hypothetical protein
VRRTWRELELSVKFVNLFRLHLPPVEGGAERASFKKFSAIATKPNEVNFIGITYQHWIRLSLSSSACNEVQKGADMINFYWHY